MTLNLLRDPWIPAIQEGMVVTIRPDQIAETGISRLAWSRPDFNLACLEMLIGLVSMADPPESDCEWRSRLDRPDPDRLRNALAPFAPHFQLAGEGPRFLQDLEAFESEVEISDVRSVDMLFIDSAGKDTIRNNADLMVKRNRALSLPTGEAAMALYTLQAFAPSGGRGNRTSMRGGGPLTTLVQPLDEREELSPIWWLISANVRPGRALCVNDAEVALPWLRPTRTSESNQAVIAKETHPLEVFFGMPRRLRLIFDAGRVTGVVQRPYGANYAAWQHPLTPYYRKDETAAEWLPVRPRPGRLSYRNWSGIVMRTGGNTKGIRRPANAVQDYYNHADMPDFEIMVGGWAMDNMKPLDFVLDRYPAFPGLGEDDADRVHQLVEAANTVSGALRRALKAACRLEGETAATVIEFFFAETELEFSDQVRRIANHESTDVEKDWYSTLRTSALRMFDERVILGLASRDVALIERQLSARQRLLATLDLKLRRDLELPVPNKKEKQK